MLQINKEKREVTITLPHTDEEQLGYMRKALITLIRNYNYNEGRRDTADNIHYACDLLIALDPQIHE